MKILQLCKKFPYPIKDGESIAVTYLSRALADQGCQITLLCFNTSKHYVDLQKVHAGLEHYDAIHVVDLNNELNKWQAFKNLFTRKSYHISRFESAAFSEKLSEILAQEQFDIIQLETLYLAPYIDTIRAHSDAMIVMRAHNVEHEIWERLQKNIKFLPKKWYLQYLTAKLKRFELETLQDYDFLVPISETDLVKFRKLGYANGAAAIPIGLDLEQYDAVPIDMPLQQAMSMAFIGSLDWMPNLEGLSWFSQEIWPEIERKFPTIELHIAGRHAPKSLINQSSDRFIVHGEVEDARQYLIEHPITIVPLRSGSGMRAKILEAMALGRVVLTTTLGLEGIPAVNGEHVLVADHAEDFVRHLEFLQSHPESMRQIAAAARSFVESRYCHNQLASDLTSSIDSYREKHNLHLQNLQV